MADRIENSQPNELIRKAFFWHSFCLIIYDREVRTNLSLSRGYEECQMVTVLLMKRCNASRAKNMWL